ncbi:MAG: histidine kinase [Bacillota bacterium]|nr:histidine kinase [Bacillota bacterium]
MGKTLSGLRWKVLRAHGLAAAVAAGFFAAGLYFFGPALQDVQSWAALALLAGFLFLLLLVINTIVTVYWSKKIKRRLDDVVAFTAVLSRGNLAQRIRIADEDEIGRLERELNELAGKVQRDVESLQRLANHNEELANQVHAATIIEERQRFARELHDAVSQQLFAVVMLADAAAIAAPQESATAVQFQEIAELAGQAQQEMRALLLHLRPVQLQNETLQEGIMRLMGELERRSNLAFDFSGRLPALPRGVEHHLFRIVQEALANILRHAEADRVQVKLSAASGELFLHISDNGKGFDPQDDHPASYGLKTMRERCEEIGGLFTVTSQVGRGTRIDIRVPLKEKGEDDGGAD